MQMEIQQFIDNYREAFTDKTPLPVAFWYSREPLAPGTGKIGGCLFKVFAGVMHGTPASLSAETLGCGGGKFYTGFAPMPDRVPNFVSLTEHYKATPDLVREGIAAMDVQPAPAPWLNFARIDSLSSFSGVEGLLFLATPDILSGLAAWAYFDNNDPSAVSAPFGSGCSATLTAALAENRRGGRRAFIGLFDPSVRKHLPAGVLGFAVPMSRFREMCAAMRSTCLFGTPAWSAIRARIAASGD